MSRKPSGYSPTDDRELATWGSVKGALARVSALEAAGGSTAVYPAPDYESDVARILLDAPVTQPMPADDGPGWKRVWQNDFVIPAAKGDFPGIYGPELTGYPDGYKDTETQKKPTNYGWYYPSKVISAHNNSTDAIGVMDIHVHTENVMVNGVSTPIHMTAAPQPDPAGLSLLYARFSVRMRRPVSLPGYKNAFLLWPDSNKWGEGEIDFPENNVEINHHQLNTTDFPGDPNQKPYIVNLGAMLADWHVYTIEWYTSPLPEIPNVVRYLVDGNIVLVATRDIPYTPHHWSWQIETNIYDGTTAVTPPADSVEGHYEIDWATISTNVDGTDRTIVNAYPFTAADGTTMPAPVTVKTGTNTGTNSIASNRLRQVTSTTQWSFTTAYPDASLILTDAIIQGTCKVPSIGSAWLGFKWNASTSTGYVVKLAGSAVQFGKLAAGTFTIVSQAAFTYTAGADYKVKVRTRAGGVFVKVWLASASEPSTWLSMTRADNSSVVTETMDYSYTRGVVALLTQTNTSGTAVTAEWDDVSVIIP